MAVLADGLGGQGDGKQASSLACSELLQCGQTGEFPSEEKLEEAFLAANEKLISNQTNPFHMKSTAVYLCVNGNQAIWGHIGDSRLYYLHNNKILDFTLDHSASQLSVFMGYIKREDIPTDPGRSRLTKAMGVEDESPDIHNKIILDEGQHIFLMCSDGFWENLTDSDIEQASSFASNAQEFLYVLKTMVDKRQKADKDNNTAIAVYVEVSDRHEEE